MYYWSHVSDLLDSSRKAESDMRKPATTKSARSKSKTATVARKKTRKVAKRPALTITDANTVTIPQPNLSVAVLGTDKAIGSRLCEVLDCPIFGTVKPDLLSDDPFFPDERVRATVSVMSGPTVVSNGDGDDAERYTFAGILMTGWGGISGTIHLTRPRPETRSGYSAAPKPGCKWIQLTGTPTTPAPTTSTASSPEDEADQPGNVTQVTDKVALTGSYVVPDSPLSPVSRFGYVFYPEHAVGSDPHAEAVKMAMIEQRKPRKY